jgi:hypothetical protein
MIKNGYYGIYEGKEYKVSEDENGNFSVITKDINKCDESFKTIYPGNVYKKQINLKELEEYYYIESRAIYKNKPFNIMSNEKDGKVYLGAGDAKLAREFNFDRTDKYYYEKWVPKEDVEIIEERKDIPIEKNR